MIETAKVLLWGSLIGAVTWQPDRNTGVFQFAPDFLGSHIEIAPLTMPLRDFPYEFPALAWPAFHGLPGLLADSLPDKWGNAVIDAWLATQNRPADSFSPVERLCYIGKRGMGALEFEPAIRGLPTQSKRVDLEKMVTLANRILDERANLQGVFSGEDDKDAIENILRIGTSAGGARAKAILAWNPETNEFRSGQIDQEVGFQYWLMKFDGISNNRDKELSDPLGYGKVEYAYYLMASDAGITMAPCRLHREGGRSHFMTRRFDRTPDGEKLHMQSLGAIAHFDFTQAGAYSYEQALQVIRRLDLPREDLEQQVLRAIFNVVARNQDDHVKNIAFLMNKLGKWRLSPAFDLTYAMNPEGKWTSRHQMSINNKLDHFEREDLLALGRNAGIKNNQTAGMLDRVLQTVQNWPQYAADAGVPEDWMRRIRATFRLNLNFS
jgi:serine/threonine-protein kinase HipA